MGECRGGHRRSLNESRARDHQVGGFRQEGRWRLPLKKADRIREVHVDTLGATRQKDLGKVTWQEWSPANAKQGWEARLWRPKVDYDGTYNPYKGFPYGRGGGWGFPGSLWEGSKEPRRLNRRVERGGTRVGSMEVAEEQVKLWQGQRWAKRLARLTTRHTRSLAFRNPKAGEGGPDRWVISRTGEVVAKEAVAKKEPVARAEESDPEVREAEKAKVSSRKPAAKPTKAKTVQAKAGSAKARGRGKVAKTVKTAPKKRKRGTVATPRGRREELRLPLRRRGARGGR